MATFPSLTPSTRSFTPGEYPVTPFRARSGSEVRIRHGDVAYGHKLNLGFTLLTETEARSIIDHHSGQQGSFLSFAFPSDVWVGYTSPSTLVPSGYTWKWESIPVKEDDPDACGRYTVNCSFVSVAP